MDHSRLLARARGLASTYLEKLPSRGVAASGSREELLCALGGPMPADSEDPEAVILALAAGADRGLVASAGPRYFGFVIGGSLPAALASDWLVSAWDQNAGLYAGSPAASVIEEVAAGWILDLLGLPGKAAVGFVTGGQMANFTCLAAARHEILKRIGWDVEASGLSGAPRVQVIIGEEAHVTILSSLRLLGLGIDRTVRVPSDDQGRMIPSELRSALARREPPLIVCAQAGNVNTGAFDRLGEIGEISHARQAWLHVDGAFGLWAAAAPSLRDQTNGMASADSWAVDAHKWLNVPYDCGIAIVAHPGALRASMGATASYLVSGHGEERDPLEFVPEFSRRARGVPVYAALRSLGRRGLADLLERCCAHARLMAGLLAGSALGRVLNDIVLNQVLVQFVPPGGGDADRFTHAVIARVQRDGTCWAGGTAWRGNAAMRISVSNWSTTREDIERSAEAILRAAREEQAAWSRRIHAP